MLLLQLKYGHSTELAPCSEERSALAPPMSVLQAASTSAQGEHACTQRHGNIKLYIFCCCWCLSACCCQTSPVPCTGWLTALAIATAICLHHSPRSDDCSTVPEHAMAVQALLCTSISTVPLAAARSQQNPLQHVPQIHKASSSSMNLTCTNRGTWMPVVSHEP
jgi:hypothetical protein